MPNPNITKRAIAYTMKDLMDEKPLSQISVSDIVQDCGINRNSFYYHFKDKYDLVNWIFYTEFVSSISEVREPDWAFIERLCAFFYKSRNFYVHALADTGQNSFTEYLSEVVTATVIAWFGEEFKQFDHYEFHINFFWDGILAGIVRWLKDGAQISPKKLTELMFLTYKGHVLESIDDVEPAGDDDQQPIPADEERQLQEV